MARVLRIGGLVRGGGNAQVGSFRTNEPPSANMTRVNLDLELPWRIVVHEHTRPDAALSQSPAKYSLRVPGGVFYFRDDGEVRDWMAKHRYRKWYKQGHQNASVAGKWVSKHLYQQKRVR